MGLLRLITAQRADQPSQGFLQDWIGQSNNFWIRKQVVQKGANILNPFWTTQIEQKNAYPRHGNYFVLGVERNSHQRHGDAVFTGSWTSTPRSWPSMRLWPSRAVVSV